MPQREVKRWIRERDSRDRFAGVAEFGGDAFQELLPHRDVVEEVLHLDTRAGSSIPRLRRRERPTIAPDFAAACGVAYPRLQRDLPDARDGGKRLAAKAHRADAEEVIGRGKFTRGVLRESQR